MCSIEGLYEKGYYPEQVASSRDTTEEAVLRNEWRDKLGNALTVLPEEDARLIVLLYFEEITVKEAAEILGCRRKTIGKRRARILMELRQMIV